MLFGVYSHIIKFLVVLSSFGAFVGALSRIAAAQHQQRLKAKHQQRLEKKQTERISFSSWVRY
jgi:hypothetical protein